MAIEPSPATELGCIVLLRLADVEICFRCSAWNGSLVAVINHGRVVVVLPVGCVIGGAGEIFGLGSSSGARGVWVSTRYLEIRHICDFFVAVATTF